MLPLQVLVRVCQGLGDGRTWGPLHDLSLALDQWLSEGKREHVEALLVLAEPHRLGIQGCKAIITDTRLERDLFRGRRDDFITRAHAYVREVAPDRAEKLLRTMT